MLIKLATSKIKELRAMHHMTMLNILKRFVYALTIPS